MKFPMVLHQQRCSSTSLYYQWKYSITLTVTDNEEIKLNQIVSLLDRPYNGTPATVPGRIEAEHFDTGGEGIAYSDTDSNNRGGDFRIDEESILRFHKISTLGIILAGQSKQWLEYTVIPWLETIPLYPQCQQ